MPQLGTGVTITFDSGFFAEILNVSGPSVSREAIPVHHMGTTGGRPKLPATTYDPGRIEVEMGFAAENEPPWAGGAETVTLTIVSAGTGGTSTWAASGFMTEFEPTLPLEDRSTARAVIELSGSITVVA